LASRGVRGSRPANPIPNHRYRARGYSLCDHYCSREIARINTEAVKVQNGEKGFGSVDYDDGGTDFLVHAGASPLRN
jgi:hypothetical protein